MEQLDLPRLRQQLFQQQREWLQSKNCSRNVIKPEIKIIDVSDEVWMWVHQKYGMSQTIRFFIQYKQATALTNLLPTMVDLN